MWAEGHPVPRIAADLGKKTSAVKNRRVRLNLEPRRPLPPAETRVLVKVALPRDMHRLLLMKSRRNGQTIHARIRELIQEDQKQP